MLVPIHENVDEIAFAELYIVLCRRRNKKKRQALAMLTLSW